jgi:hypothetical protein
MAYTQSSKSLAWGFGIYFARYSGPSVSDPAGLFINRWNVAAQFGPWTWRKIF